MRENERQYLFFKITLLPYYFILEGYYYILLCGNNNYQQFVIALFQSPRAIFFARIKNQ